MSKGNQTETTQEQQSSGQSEFSRNEFLQAIQRRLQQEQQRRQFQNEQTSDTQRRSGEEFASRQTGTTTIDPRSAAFQDLIRSGAVNAAGEISADMFAPGTQDILELTAALQNPFAQEQISALEDQAQRQQGLSRVATQQAATAAGAFGGSRHGIAEGVRAAEIDRALAAETADILSSTQQRALQAALPLASQQASAPLQALLAQQGVLQGALGPTGTTTTGTQAGTQTGTEAAQNVTQQAGSSVTDLLSRLFGINQETGTQSGTSAFSQESFSKMAEQEKQSLLGSLTGLAGIALGGPLGGALGNALFGGDE